MVESKAPVRVDFAGAWTDVQPVTTQPVTGI